MTLLTAKLNPSLGNSSFDIKRPEITKSLLALNAHFQQAQFNLTGAVWDEGCIRGRARDLFAVAKKVWPHPAA